MAFWHIRIWSVTRENTGVITISIALSVSTFIALYGFMSLLTESVNRYANDKIDLRVYMSSYKSMSVDEANQKSKQYSEQDK